MKYCIEKFEQDFNETEQERFIMFFDEYWGDLVDDFRDKKYDKGEL